MILLPAERAARCEDIVASLTGHRPLSDTCLILFELNSNKNFHKTWADLAPFGILAFTLNRQIIRLKMVTYEHTSLTFY